MDETWKPIPGYEGFYEVSDLGRVRSLDRAVPRAANAKSGAIQLTGRTIKPHINYAGGRQGGRLTVALTKDSIRSNFLVHRLVAQAFIPNPNNLSDATHIDHNPLNNAVSNLEWLSHRQNIRDSVHAGRWRKKLSEDQVRTIQRRIASGEAQVAIARDLGLAYGTINSIAAGRSWRHVDNGAEVPMILTEDLISQIIMMSASGKSPAEILASLPRKRKPRKSV